MFEIRNESSDQLAAARAVPHAPPPAGLLLCHFYGSWGQEFWRRSLYISRMQANPTERLQRALAGARVILNGGSPASMGPLRQELASIAEAVENIMAIWDKMEKGGFDLQSVDANFYSAGETYLDCVEKLTEALDQKNTALLDEVDQLLNRAGRQLVAANEKAQAELQRLAKAGGEKPAQS